MSNVNQSFNCRITEEEDVIVRKVLQNPKFDFPSLRSLVVTCVEMLDSGEIDEKYRQYKINKIRGRGVFVKKEKPQWNDLDEGISDA